MPDHDDEILLRSVRSIVEALGGIAAVAELLGVGPTAVANWLAYDVIPPRWYLLLSDVLAERGRKADRKLFRELPRTARTANAT